MKVSTPAISWHNRERISSVDFQPICFPSQTDNSRSVNRLASGGDDKHVVIWDINVGDDRFENKNECGKIEPSCLCDLSRHQNTVNIVRWSPNGKILASGDSDSVVFLWHFQDEKTSRPDLFNELEDGPEGENNAWAENWGVLKILRGHLQDVVGLAWSSCSSLLATCSTDATTIVFDINKGTKLKILSEHKGWVNGVAWARTDPFSDVTGNQKGNLATLASDRCLRVFNASTKNFKNVTKTHRCKLRVPVTREKVKEENVENNLSTKTEEIMESMVKVDDIRNVRLFHDDTFPSFYRRLDFSPDGELLVVPSGVLDIEGETTNAPHCTFIFCTSNYNKPVIYLPGKEFSVAVRFSPILYALRPVKRKNGLQNKSQVLSSKEDEKNSDLVEEDLKPWEKYQTTFCLPYRMIYAIATQNSIMLYDTQQTEPFARISRIHYIGLNDLTWSADGNTLVVSSTDGYCSIINFKQGELGEVYRPTEIKENINETPNEPKRPQTEPSNIENKDTIPNTDSAMDCNDSNILQHNHSDADKKVDIDSSVIQSDDKTANPDICPMDVEVPNVNLSQNKLNNSFSSERVLNDSNAINDEKKKSPEKPRKRIQLITLSSSISKNT